MRLKNYSLGQWIEGSGKGRMLFDASTGEEVAIASSEGLDFKAMINYGRDTGGKVLRKMTFQERGLMLKKLALYLTARKDKFYPISYKTGATKVDSWIDIEGGNGNLFANASLRRKLPDMPYVMDGETVPLSKGGSFVGHHIMVQNQVLQFISMHITFQFGEC